MYGWNFLGFNLCTSLLFLSMGTIICFYQNFIGIEQILLRHIFHAESFPLSLPFLHKRCSNPFIPYVVLYWLVSSAFLSLPYLEVKNRTLFFWCVSQEMSRGERSPCWTPGNAFSNAILNVVILSVRTAKLSCCKDSKVVALLCLFPQIFLLWGWTWDINVHSQPRKPIISWYEKKNIWPELLENFSEESATTVG